MKTFFITLTIVLIVSAILSFYKRDESIVNPSNFGEDYTTANREQDEHPLTIEILKNIKLESSDLVIEQTLESGSNYERFIASYESCDKSDCLKIYGLLTVPSGDLPAGGFPAIIFNHGYIPPAEYRTTERYVSYVDGFARAGFVVFKPDYRGHGESEGEPTGAYGSNGYTFDVLNALASIKKYPGVNPEKIGMWGHSLGGFLTLRSMVVARNIKAAVIWAGVVGSYPDLLNNWRRGTFTPPPGIPSSARRWRQVLVEKYGTPDINPVFWNSISANAYLSDISGPLQLHHGTAGTSVPVEFSQKLEKEMNVAGKGVELYKYDGDDHNLSQNFSVAMQRSVEFFDKYLK